MSIMKVDEERFRNELLNVGFSYVVMGMILDAFKKADGIFEQQ